MSWGTGSSWTTASGSASAGLVGLGTPAGDVGLSSMGSSTSTCCAGFCWAGGPIRTELSGNTRGIAGGLGTTALWSPNLRNRGPSHQQNSRNEVIQHFFHNIRRRHLQGRSSANFYCLASQIIGTTAFQVATCKGLQIHNRRPPEGLSHSITESAAHDRNYGGFTLNVCFCDVFFYNVPEH